MDIKNCRVCNSNALTDVIDLGNQPWCNDFVQEEQLGSEKTYPLVCCFCDVCSTLQVRYTVPKEIMYSDHTYLSGSTKTMTKHFQKVSNYVCENLVEPEGLVVDIGSNDGTLLSTYKNNGMKVHGVEPSRTISKIAIDNNIPTDCNYFDKEYASHLEKLKGKAKVISAANVFYHVEELHSIVEGINQLLDKSGVFVIQASYLPNLIRDKAFDIMYHEHLLYYRVENLNFLLNLHGMEVFDVHHADVHGGSIVVYCAHKGERKIEDTVYTMINEEREKGFHKADIYVDFNSQIQDLRKKLLTLVNDLKEKDSKIFAYFASHLIFSTF